MSRKITDEEFNLETKWTAATHFDSVMDIETNNNELKVENIKEKLKEYLLEKGVWEREVDEVLGNFNDDVTEAGLVISTIFDSAFDLGSYYIDNTVGTLNHHIEAVLDYSELGKHIAESDDEYLLLDSGRIIEFEM